MMTTKNWFPRVTEFARTFHSLDRAPGIESFDANTLWAWVQEGKQTPAERYTVLFVLNVWGNAGDDSDRPWPAFDAMDALARWDKDNRSAFLAWAKEPWWA